MNGPNGDGQERAINELGPVRLVALEGHADEPQLHLVDELVGRDRELEEEGGFGGAAVVLDAQPHVAAAVAEDCADDHGFRGAGLLGQNHRDDVVLGGGRGGRLGILVLGV